MCEHCREKTKASLPWKAESILSGDLYAVVGFYATFHWFEALQCGGYASPWHAKHQIIFIVIVIFMLPLGEHPGDNGAPLPRGGGSSSLAWLAQGCQGGFILRTWVWSGTLCENNVYEIDQGRASSKISLTPLSRTTDLTQGAPPLLAGLHLALILLTSLHQTFPSSNFQLTNFRFF